jgi:cellulose synthase/poly-beta-1,6-N-acetylglucosamine synthase-like glycosyltransferase
MITIKSIQELRKRLADKASVGLFFFLAALWCLLMYFTITPWLFGYTLPIIKNGFDISILTWILVIISLQSSVLWFFAQIGYLLVGDKVVNHQRRALKESSSSSDNKLKPLVSIIIPAHNEEAVIKRTASSCLAQTYKNVEVIVVCHNCTDDSYSSLNQLNDKRVRAFDYKTKNAGKGIALDFGVKNSNGDYIVVLDSDGTLENDFVTTALSLFESDNIAAVQGKLLPNNRHHNIITQLLSLEGDLFSIPYMTIKTLLDKRTSLGGTGYIIRKEILLKVGGFKNSLIDDFELSFRLFRNNYRIVFAPLSISHDERPPELALMLRQRSRWIKGHIDLLKERVPEASDIMGNLYWLNPIFMICGLGSIIIVSIGLIYYLIFGILPFKFSFTPIFIWIAMTIVGYFLQLSILVKQNGIKGLRLAGYLALTGVFSHYWYVTLLKAFFVKSWSNTKTTHGHFSVKDMARLSEEVNKKDIKGN